ncbi:MAG TPA: imidazolonepropionase [Thermoanaerobaculia bacterium]|jgi:imidazolonepropionase|nr:imidazolonepropionase [Thermoanaerobaculia bacterium]
MLLVRNLKQIATPLGRNAVRGAAMRKLAVYDDEPVIVVDGERIVYAGPERDNPHRIDDDFDGRGATAIPGFVDSHTHIPFAGFRESEFNRRLQGETYAEIAASGGGIVSTVRHTRAATEEELAANVFARTATMAQYGTTTAEAKSGYGLNVEDELKQLRAIRRVSSRSPVRLVPTCLAAHDFPPENKTASYVNEVIEKILPAVAEEKLATFCDAFVERNVFTREQGDAVLRAGAKLGMTPRLHADELSDTDGAALAAELGAASADHLMFVSDRGIEALASSDTVANLLPATSFFLMSERYAPARELLDRGAIVSLSTDCNPGSSMTESMQTVIQLATLRMKLTVEEALTAATLNGAYSLRMSNEIGSIEPGKRADFVLIEAPNYLHLVYHFGVNLVTAVFRDGQRVV